MTGVGAHAYGDGLSTNYGLTPRGKADMRYQVRFVEDAALSEVEWAFARVEGVTYLFIRQSAIDTHTGECAALTRAWETWQRVDPAIHVPDQRVASVQLEKAAG